MYTRLTNDQVESLNYRERRVELQLRRMERLFSGRGESLLPFVRGKNGEHSERRTWELVEGLTGALEQTERLPLSERERSFFRAFLYCAIRISGEGTDWVETDGSFEDILKIAEHIWPRDITELHYYELYRSPELDGFFGGMDAVYRLFTGAEITETITTEERAAARARHPEEAAEMEALWREHDKLMEELDEEELRLLLTETAEPEDEWDILQERRQREWVDAFAEKESFCRQYLLCRTLYFEAAADEGTPLSGRLRRMLNVFLSERGVSSYPDDDRFFAAYALLDETARRIQGLLQGG